MQAGETEKEGMARTGKPFLDARLTAAYDMVPHCSVCADIGADHGKLSAALLSAGRAEHMLVADISDKALSKSRLLLSRLCLADKATFAVADGLNALDAVGEKSVDAALILGMGGDTIAGILRRGKSRLQGMTLILGAHTELPVLRQALCEVGYRLRKEQVCQAEGRYYIVMCAAPEAKGDAPYGEEELWLGPCLMKTLPPQWAHVLLRRAALLQRAQAAMEAGANPRDALRLAETRRELDSIQKALAALEKTKSR